MRLFQQLQDENGIGKLFSGARVLLKLEAKGLVHFMVLPCGSTKVHAPF